MDKLDLRMNIKGADEKLEKLNELYSQVEKVKKLIWEINCMEVKVNITPLTEEQGS